MEVKEIGFLNGLGRDERISSLSICVESVQSCCQKALLGPALGARVNNENAEHAPTKTSVTT